MEITENQMFIGFVSLIIVLILYKCYESRESFGNLENIDYMFYRPPDDCNLNGSCKDCDKTKKESIPEPPKNVIFSRPNKCFSCEKEMLQKYARQYINLAFPGKCISCEKEASKMGKDPYHEGPTKCFSCMGNGK